MRAVIIGTLLAATIGAILLIDLLPSNQVLLDAGDVSPATSWLPPI